MRTRRATKRRSISSIAPPRSSKRVIAASKPLEDPDTVVSTSQNDHETLRFVNSVDGPRLAELGTSCPDHFLRTKIKPLFVDWHPDTGDAETLKAALSKGLAAYRNDYAAYYSRCKRPDSPPMRDSNPTVVLIPGLGLIA